MKLWTYSHVHEDGADSGVIFSTLPPTPEQIAKAEGLDYDPELDTITIGKNNPTVHEIKVIDGEQVKTDVIGHMSELLDEKNRELDKQREELNELNEKLELEREWCWHDDIDEKGDKLPVPRLEIRARQENHGRGPSWHSFRQCYALVYKHLLGHHVRVPLGETRISGMRNEPPIIGGVIDLPFRDGAHLTHDMDHLNLPAFAICGTRIEKLVRKEDGLVHREIQP